MEEVDSSAGRYEQTDSISNSESTDNSGSSNYESNDSDDDPSLCGQSEPTDSPENDLKQDLQNSVAQYKSNLNLSSQNTKNGEFQATSLCQFMDILNDLDNALDNSLLACLDDPKGFDSDEEDALFKTKLLYSAGPSHSKTPYPLGDEVVSEDNNYYIPEPSAPPLSLEYDMTQDIVTYPDRSQDTIQGDITSQDNIASTQETCQTSITDLRKISQDSSQNFFINTQERPLGRSKSLTDLSLMQREVNIEPNTSTMDTVRNSMRRLDPIVLPALSQEPLTLPVMLFLEHHGNDLRSSGTPIDVQVSAANGSSTSGPVVGRRALAMNSAMSVPSPDLNGDWMGRNTARSTARRSSLSSSSSNDSLSGVMPVNRTITRSFDDRNEHVEEPPFGVWPHSMSSMLACLSCTVGIFNISRFATLSVHFGASFIIQFFIVSFLVGIPLFTLFLCLGQVLEAGPMDMWKISPIFQGVGITILVTQAVIGMYSIIGVSWIFVYFRDSFISPDERYKWSLPREFSTEEGITNITYKIQETLPQYFHSEVLQRNYGSDGLPGTVKFQTAFNLAVVWMIVFVALSKGLRSYGKAVYMLIFLPICGTLVLCIKLLTLIPYDSVTNIFSDTDWSEFFINSNSWVAAIQETFLTWGILGACIMQLTSHKNSKNKTNLILQKESACIVSSTFAVLLLASFLANTCVKILKNYKYNYIPGSYESAKSSQFLWPTAEPLPGNLISTPVRYMTHYSSLVGVTVWRQMGLGPSGWQPLQLATQLVPATLAVLPNHVLSPAWAVIFYFILIMFGIAQQLAIWHCVITGIMAINPKALRVWETTITFFSCVFGLCMGLLLTTDAGIKLVHFMDYVWIGSWWHCAIHVALMVGVFVVRGRPYSADVVVVALYDSRGCLSSTLAGMLSFCWTVALPALICALGVMDLRASQQKQLYNLKKVTIGYWPLWSRYVAVFMQLGAILNVFFVAFIQAWRYMGNGPPDIFERIQNLYRPQMQPRTPVPRRAVVPAYLDAPRTPVHDPPPKYTPPPSYSTATGARFISTLRRSFRTLRRITTTQAEVTAQDTSLAPITVSESVERSPPPQYSSGNFTPPNFTISDEIYTRHNPNRSTSNRSLSLRRSFVCKSDSFKSMRSSLRRNFKFRNALSTSNEQLVRDAEPISNTLAMPADDESQDQNIPSTNDN